MVILASSEAVNWPFCSIDPWRLGPSAQKAVPVGHWRLPCARDWRCTSSSVGTHLCRDTLRILDCRNKYNVICLRNCDSRPSAPCYAFQRWLYGLVLSTIVGYKSPSKTQALRRHCRLLELDQAPLPGHPGTGTVTVSKSCVLEWSPLCISLDEIHRSTCTCKSWHRTCHWTGVILALETVSLLLNRCVLFCNGRHWLNVKCQSWISNLRHGCGTTAIIDCGTKSWKGWIGNDQDPNINGLAEGQPAQ